MPSRCFFEKGPLGLSEGRVVNALVFGPEEVIAKMAGGLSRSEVATLVLKRGGHAAWVLVPVQLSRVHRFCGLSVNHVLIRREASPHRLSIHHFLVQTIKPINLGVHLHLVLVDVFLLELQVNGTWGLGLLLVGGLVGFSGFIIGLLGFF